MLTALALGARELASLPTTSTATSRSSKPIFPSKMLPTTLHRKYLLAEEVNADPGPVGLLAQDISRSALERGRKEAEDRVPQIIREKQLRIRKPAPSIVDVSAARRGQGAIPFEASDRAQGQTAFKDIAAEYFIIPLIERFWQHLRDEQTRETRFKSRSEYRGAGTGMILDALVLRQILSTLAVLAHAARHSTAFLRILAPEALEVAVTIGTRPVSVVTTTDDEFGETEKAEKEASVLASSLELALVVLDACVDLDGGRELGLEKTMLVLATRDWASEVFRRLEKTGGVEVDKASGDHVNRVRRSATGVLLKIEEVTNRWSRSMISL